MFLGWFLAAGRYVPEQADWAGLEPFEVGFKNQAPLSGMAGFLFIFFLFKSLQGGGGQLLDTPLGEEGTLDGFELWSGLGVLQGGVGGCHRSLRTVKRLLMFEIRSKSTLLPIENNFLFDKQMERVAKNCTQLRLPHVFTQVEVKSNLQEITQSIW